MTLWPWPSSGAAERTSVLPRVERTLIPWIVAFFAARAVLASLRQPLGEYDEGLLLAHAFAMREGQVPHRDFYTSYPAGILYLVRFSWWLGGYSVWSTRVCGALLRLAAALLAGALAGRLRGSRFCVWTLAGTLALYADLGLALFAYPVAVVAALLAILAWPTTGSGRHRHLLAGVLLGVVSWFRHDLFTYSALMLLAAESGYWLSQRRSLFANSARELLWLGAGCGGALFLFWGPVLLRGGPLRVLDDLVIAQATHVMPARVLTPPTLFDFIDVPNLELELPLGLTHRMGVGLILVLLGPAVTWGVVSARRYDATAAPDGLRLLALAASFATATLPQALNRVDYPHVAAGVPLVLPALMGAVAQRLWLRELALLVTLIPALIRPPPLARWADVERFWRERGDEHFVGRARAEARAFLLREAGFREPVFIGCMSHERIVINSPDLYYLGRCLGATRYLHFDPGIVTSEERQLEMIEDLERSKPRVALRRAHCAWFEDNASQDPGSKRLDEYLRARYAYSESAGLFEIWRRLPEAPPSAR